MFANPSHISRSDTMPGNARVFSLRDRTGSMDRGASSTHGPGASEDLFLQLKKSFFVPGGNYLPKHV
jgi:hypothetical protein